MIALEMKRLNPEKKVFFICDRIPLVFQQAAYLRFQCNLIVGEFCGENKDILNSQMISDVFVLTADFFINMLMNKTLYLEDSCLLIIDEIHHAREGHSFSKLIQNFYFTMNNEYRPRIIGCET